MAFLLISFIAGVLTVLAPCILPLLPIVVGSSASRRSRLTPYVVVISLSISIILFPFLLKFSTSPIMIPPYVWTCFSGGIIIIFGLILLFPKLWEMMPFVSHISSGSSALLGSGAQKKTFLGDAIVGFSLGPVFSSCSPTYFVILASVLPASFALGTVYLFAYVLGLSLILLLIGLIGQRFSNKLLAASDPRGILKKTVGVLFIALGLAIATGYEKKLEIAILDSGYFDVTKIEQRLLKIVE